MLEQPPQAHLATAITERLRRDPGGDVDDCARLRAGALDEPANVLVVPFQRDQCACIECDSPQCGSDLALRDTYVLVTAHYDHLGVRGTGEGDHIYNGAN